MTEAVTTSEKKLYLEFHDRVIEHLGIQMYQSPVNANRRVGGERVGRRRDIRGDQAPGGPPRSCGHLRDPR